MYFIQNVTPACIDFRFFLGLLMPSYDRRYVELYYQTYRKIILDGDRDFKNICAECGLHTKKSLASFSNDL
jgi:hypothetical protein